MTSLPTPLSRTPADRHHQSPRSSPPSSTPTRTTPAPHHLRPRSPTSPDLLIEIHRLRSSSPFPIHRSPPPPSSRSSTVHHRPIVTPPADCDTTTTVLRHHLHRCQICPLRSYRELTESFSPPPDRSTAPTTASRHCLQPLADFPIFSGTGNLPQDSPPIPLHAPIGSTTVGSTILRFQSIYPKPPSSPRLLHHRSTTPGLLFPPITILDPSSLSITEDVVPVLVFSSQHGSKSIHIS